MPRGKTTNGDWNFRIKRSKCPNCNKKGMYKSREKGWIMCMYCNLLETLKYSDNYKKLLSIINQ